jgi:hypothetical protein
VDLTEERREIGNGSLQSLTQKREDMLSLLVEGLPDRLDHHPPGMRLKKPLHDRLLEDFIDRGDLA